MDGPVFPTPLRTTKCVSSIFFFATDVIRSSTENRVTKRQMSTSNPPPPSHPRPGSTQGGALALLHWPMRWALLKAWMSLWGFQSES